MLSNSYRVFESLRGGTLREGSLDEFSNDDLRPFLPVLMFSAFQQTSVEDGEYLDFLRSRLLEIHAGNQFQRFMSLDFTKIGTFLEGNDQEVWELGNEQIAARESSDCFPNLSELEQTQIIALHVMKGQMLFEEPSSALPSPVFYPFDAEICQEQTIWILSLLLHNFPERFQVSSTFRCLLGHKNAPFLILNLVLNWPGVLEEVFDLLLLFVKDHHSTGEDHQQIEFVSRQAREALKLLLQLDKDQAQQLLSSLLENDLHVKFSVEMICEEIIDDRFFIDTMVAQLANKSSKFTLYVTRPANKNAMKRISSRLEKVFDRLSNKSSQGARLEDRVVLLVALLSSLPSFRPSQEEGRRWLSFLTRPSFVRCIQIKAILGTILACPNLLPDQVSFRDEVIERHLLSFFVRIRALAMTAEYASLSQLMLLAAIHMITDKADGLASLLSSVLGFACSKTLQRQPVVKRLFLEHAMSDRDIAEKAANIAITEGLSAKDSGYLPIHCISHLLQSGAFSRYQIPIQDWVKRQLCACVAPVHPHMAILLDNFARSCLPPLTVCDEERNFNKKIEEQFFMDVFEEEIFDSRKLVLQVLSLFYLVSYGYKLDTAYIPREIADSRRAPSAYSQSLWFRVPVRFLLTMVDTHAQNFEHIRPQLLHFITATMPHFLPDLDCALSSINDQITEELQLDVEMAFERDQMETSFDESFLTTSFLDRLERASLQEQYRHYQLIVGAMCSSLDKLNFPRPLLDKLAFVWRRLECLVPHKLYEDTLRAWLKGAHHAPLPGSMTVDELDADKILVECPAILFRIDDRVFRSPTHFRCFVRLLSFYMDALRSVNTIRLARIVTYGSKSLGDGDQEKHQLFKGFTGAQHLLVAQLLIELCDGDLDERPELMEIRKIACDQLHQMFIADNMLPKVLHFNTYPIRLIPMVIRGVPSAHVLITFIGELLSNPSLRRRIFGICLMAELIEQYKIPAAFAGLTLVDELLQTALASGINQEELVMLLLATVPALIKMARISPFHTERFVEFLSRFKKVLSSRIATYGSVLQARASPERRLFDFIHESLEKADLLPSGSENVKPFEN